MKTGDVPDSGDAMVRYTELIGDFFVTVLSNINDPLWKLHSISQMRSYVATALIRDILDILRRSKRQLDVIGKEDESGFDTALASQAKDWFVRQSENFEATLDYESALQRYYYSVDTSKSITDSKIQAFHVTEFVAGVPITEYVRDSVSRETGDRIPRILDLFNQLAETVRQIHELGYLHRDISGGNILVDSSAKIRVIDLAEASRL